jgi:putative transposase
MYEYRRLARDQREEIVKERWLKGFPPHSPPHPMIDATEFLITAACFEHRSILDSPERRRDFSAAVLQRAIECDVQVSAWVILPNHYHLLLRASIDSIAKYLKKVNGSTANQWNKEDGAQGRQVWYRYSDRAIRGENHWYAVLSYIHENPVKHGYVHDSVQWEASSVHWYSKSWGDERLNQISPAYMRAPWARVGMIGAIPLVVRNLFRRRPR